MTRFKLTRHMLETGNAPHEARINAEWAAEIRAFRPEPVSNLSDKQLAWVIGRSRKAARDFGVRDTDVTKNWTMVKALLAPGFFAIPSVIDHFQSAFGDPDTKARDVLQHIKITLRDNGRAAEIWW